MDNEAPIRSAAFSFLEELRRKHDGSLPRVLLTKGFEFRGERVPLVGPQGIFKPKVMRLPLSITTAPVKEGRAPRYQDTLQEGFVRYCYRGTDPQHSENRGLRECMRKGIPLAYFFGVVPGIYEAQWPVRIVKDDERALHFLVAFDEGSQLLSASPEARDPETDARAYRTTLIQVRNHQRSFRERVLRAYKAHCAVCRLRHPELLDAAHILPDGHPRGLPVVPNGLSLCKLHHAAFDENVIRIRADYVIELRADVLEEEDGPMLEHGLKGFHGKVLLLPRAPSLRPNPDLLEERYRGLGRAS